MEFVFGDLRSNHRKFDHLMPARAGIIAFETDPTVRTGGRSYGYHAIHPVSRENFPQMGLVARLASRSATGRLRRRTDHGRRIGRRWTRRVAGVPPQSPLEFRNARQGLLEFGLERCDACVAPSVVTGTTLNGIIAHALIIGR